MPDAQLQDLAAENPTATQERKKLREKMALLEKGLCQLIRLNKFRPKPRGQCSQKDLLSFPTHLSLYLIVFSSPIVSVEYGVCTPYIGVLVVSASCSAINC